MPYGFVMTAVAESKPSRFIGADFAKNKARIRDPGLQIVSNFTSLSLGCHRQVGFRRGAGAVGDCWRHRRPEAVRRR